jgi:hypothetical protein
MLVDFERSRLCGGRPPCDLASPCRKTYRVEKGKRKVCMYCREMWIAGAALAYESPHTSPIAGMTSGVTRATQHQTNDEPSAGKCEGSVFKSLK